jgi:hypothetical protein
MRKAACLGRNDTAIDEVYSIVEALIWALYRAKEAPNADEIAKDRETVQNVAFYDMFLHMMNRITDNSEKYNLLRKLITHLRKEFPKQPAVLTRLFHCFLTRGLNTDLITESLSRDEVLIHLEQFYKIQASQQNLTVSQYEQIERVSLKHREIHNLSEIVLKIASGGLKLKKDREPHRSEQPEVKWPIEERRKKVKSMRDYLE